MSKPLIDRSEIRLAMLGCTPGNAHPYSWSAIFNGYDRERMTRECPIPAIADYLNKEPADEFPIPGARVTHICCTGEDVFNAEHIAACSLIPNVVKRPEDVIGEVDAVIVATDIGAEHVERCRPFVEAGLPLFVDKPMVDNAADLAVFDQWIADGHPILSTSCMRYAKEFTPYRLSTHNLGSVKAVIMTMAKSWETYGIHAMEALYPILGPGFLSCQHSGTGERNLMRYTHTSGADAIAYVRQDLGASWGVLNLLGSEGHDTVCVRDSFYAFKAQLKDFVQYLRTGERPFPYAETRELMQMIVAGLRSREEGGREVRLDEIQA